MKKIGYIISILTCVAAIGADALWINNCSAVFADTNPSYAEINNNIGTIAIGMDYLDTDGPVIAQGDVTTVFGCSNTYSIEDLNLTAIDESEVSDITIRSCKYGEVEAVVTDNTFTPTNAGENTIEVEVEDVYGNQTIDTITIDVVRAPHFVVLRDRQYQIGTDLGPDDLVFAQDRDGNDISDRVEIVSDGGYDPYTPGDYEVTYSVTDYDGINMTDSITISIGDFEDNDYGFDARYYMDLLIANDAFQYEPLESNDDNNFDEVIRRTSPTSFGVYAPDGFFSAFIYRITEDYVYLMTNAHCPISNGFLYLYDYEGREIWVDPSFVIQESIPEYRNATGYIQYDLRAFAVPTWYFPNILNYREVHLDMDAFYNLQDGDMYLMNTQSWCQNDHDIISVNEIVNTQIDYDYVIYADHRDARPGCSGSACFDRFGNFIGVLRGRYYDVDTTYEVIVPADSAVNFANSFIDNVA